MVTKNISDRKDTFVVKLQFTEQKQKKTKGDLENEANNTPTAQER